MKKLAYHILKEGLIGETLYPLNQLKQIHPEIYHVEAKKYEGREKLMETVNPILHCLWNNVLQFSCLDPRITFHVAKKYNPQLNGRRFKVFALNLENIKPEHAALFTPIENICLYEFEDSQFEAFHLESFYNLTEVPANQIKRWEDDVANNRRPLLWSRTKHFLYKDKIHLSDGDIFEFDV